MKKKILLLGGLAVLFAVTAFADPVVDRNGIVSSASFAPALSPGGAIAQGSIFSIFGSGLGPAATAQPTAFPLGATLGGASIKVIAGSASFDAIPVYVSPTLINAIMPSGVPVGKVSVQVTFGGVKSNMAPVNIAANAPGIYTATGAGSGPGILQNFSPAGVPVNSTKRPIKPGNTGIL